MSWKKLLLLGMIGYDLFLHVFELIMGYFPSFSYFDTRLGYTIFWTLFWLIGLILLLSIKEEISIKEEKNN